MSAARLAPMRAVGISSSDQTPSRRRYRTTAGGGCRLPYQRGECRPGTCALPAGVGGIVGREAPEHSLAQPVWRPGDRQRRQSNDAPHRRVARPGAIGLPRMIVGTAWGCNGTLWLTDASEQWELPR